MRSWSNPTGGWRAGERPLEFRTDVPPELWAEGPPDGEAGDRGPEPPGRAMGLVRLALTIVLLLLLPALCSGQTAWETPRLLSPETPGGLGLYWVRFSALPGDGDGAFVTWSPPSFPAALSLRAGAARGAGGVASGFGGVDVVAPLSRRSPELPLDLSWTTGAGVAVGDWVLVSVPVGIVAGRSWTSGPVWLSPYVAGRLALDLRLGADAPEREFDVGPGVDVGLDLALDRARRAVVRFGASLGDRNALAVGVALGGPRP